MTLLTVCMWGGGRITIKAKIENRVLNNSNITIITYLLTYSLVQSPS